jgi:hypothetical protein
VAEYIQRFEEAMSLMQMDYPGLSEPYFISSFIAGLKEGIKYYLIPHNPQTLCETYWKAKELEKGILLKKSLLSTPSSYSKSQLFSNPTLHPKIANPAHPSSTTKPPPTTQPNTPNTTKQILLKPREPEKCWGCHQPWTPKHKFSCKFWRAVNAMSMEPNDWLAVEQQMEEENHVLLQEETTSPPPQLLMISSHAVHGTVSAATFSLLVTIGGKKGVALIDSGSTYSFIDCTFASKTSCSITATTSRKVKVAGGGSLDSCAITRPTAYFIQQQDFHGQFRLLQLKGQDLIIVFDWIKAHSPISLDLRDDNRQLTIHKQVTQPTVFKDFTSPPAKPVINTAKLEKLCRTETLGYVIQINMIRPIHEAPASYDVLPGLSALLREFEAIFAGTNTLPPPRPQDHEILLKPDNKPPNVKPYRVPYKQKDEVEKLIHTMLKDELIRPSHSPYSSLAILVRKKDVSWRLCIDYKELNSQTIKNKFPIPLIEDLLDELDGAQIFTS